LYSLAQCDSKCPAIKESLQDIIAYSCAAIS
jgi:hypothetical protein